MNITQREKYYGYFGSFHTNLNSDEFTIGKYIDKEYSVTKGKVLSVDMIYDNCYLTDAHNNYIESKVEKNKYSKIISKYADSDFSLLKLKGDPKNLEYHYVLLIKNSKGTEVYSK